LTIQVPPARVQARQWRVSRRWRPARADATGRLLRAGIRQGRFPRRVGPPWRRT